MTVTSLTMRRNGSWNWTAVTAFRGRAIIHPGWSRKRQRLQQEKSREQAHQRSIHAELEWVRSNPKGRRAKSKARLQRFEELNSQEITKSAMKPMKLFIPPGPRLGNQVIEVNNISKGFDDRLLIDDLSFNVFLPGPSLASLVAMVPVNPPCFAC